MKTLQKFLSVFVFMALTVAAFSLQAQSAREGKNVVSRGFETCDSVRFAIHRGYDVGCWLNFDVDTVFDSMGANAVENFDISVPKTKSFYGHQRVYSAPGRLYAPCDGANELPGTPQLNDIVTLNRERIYYPFPQVISGDDARECRFRYNDLLIAGTGAQWFHNNFDSNDVSPYVEYPANPGFVTDTFRTYRFGTGTVDSLVIYGNEGRVIAGYSDDRIAQHLLTTCITAPFHQNPIDTTKAFSVNLEFWIDTTTANINRTQSHGLSVDNIPLVRLQVLYKPGARGGIIPYGGQPLLPFVPFRDASHPTNAGWYKCLDTVVTRSIFNSLPDDWRADDSVFTGSTGSRARNWRCKQLHTMFTLSHEMDSLRSSLADSASAFYNAIGDPALGDSMIAYWRHPDSLVADWGTGVSTQSDLIEIRILSTYRTKVRVRDLTYEDTFVDRYLNRRRFGDTTHSVEQNGAYGGNDSLMENIYSQWHALLTPNLPREITFNDVGGSPKFSHSMMGYFDYLGTKYGLYAHTRPQDGGSNSQIYRRERMSFDDQPPAVFENQYHNYNSDYLPNDYVYYGHRIEPSTNWGYSKLDTLMGLVIARQGTDSDPLKAYHLYEQWEAAQSEDFRALRATSRVAQWHPWSKRFGTEYSLKAMSYIRNNGRYDSAGSIYFRGYYDATLGVWISPTNLGYRSPGMIDNFPLTPEMITTGMYGAFASGTTAISADEALGNALPDTVVHDIGAFTSPPRSNSDNSGLASRVHNYNVGHYYTCRPFAPNPDSSDMDGPLQNYYLGVSNTWRALVRGISRMDAIWAKGDHPFRNFRWMDSYSLYNATNPSRNIPFIPADSPVGLDDSLALQTAFLKVIKTQAVDPWNRQGKDSAYIDAAIDPDTSRQTIVGLFIDSINSSTKNYAALIVNPRCWPSRDTGDINYYNRRLDSISMMHPTLGDIDVRKVYLKLDTTQFPSSFRTTYYVVRDLWHSDSTWLVHKDSTFAIYLKPGDAKFLYIEKGIAVNVASKTGTDTGKSSMPEFGFNNGRRVAERLNGTRSVVTYTRRNKLYVAYPAAGSTYAGTDQSSGDNIITGFEQALDTTHSHSFTRNEQFIGIDI
jgi:hypothetical protein